jgi:anti-sigma-K factor RskA/putative zinc finger protein
MTAGHPQDDLPGLLLGGLPPATPVAVDRHLAGCDPCRRDLAAVAVASSALRDASRLAAEAPGLPPLRPPAAGPPEPSALGPPARPGVPRWRPGVPRWRLGAATVLVALLLGIGGLTLARDGEGNGGQTVALAAPAGGPATAQARMRGTGDEQVMAMTARGLPRPPAGAYYEVWLVRGGAEFPVGVLGPTGEGIWSLPSAVAASYRAIHVTLEPADGNPSRSPRTVLSGAYA